MNHVDIPAIRSFLLELALRHLMPLQTTRVPVLGHLLDCNRCRLRVQAVASTMERSIRVTLYPEPECPKDSEIGQSRGQSALESSISTTPPEKTADDDSDLPLLKLGNAAPVLPMNMVPSGYFVEGRSPHLDGCLWCILVFHDALVTEEVPTKNAFHEELKSAIRSMLRAAHLPKVTVLQPMSIPLKP